MHMTESQSPISYTALVLKVVGIILILGTIVDLVILAVPPDFLNQAWLSSLIEGWVSRGTIPLLGLALVLFSSWVSSQRSETKSRSQSRWLLGALSLSALLGLIFLIMSPLYFNSSRLASAEATRSINQDAVAAQQQLETLLSQQRSRVSELLADEERVAQLQQQLESAQLPPDQQAQLQQVQETLKAVQADPKALDRKVEESRKTGLAQIQARQDQALAQSSQEMRKARIRVTLQSLVLAIGYLTITWAGISTAKPSGIPAKTKLKKSKKAKKAT